MYLCIYIFVSKEKKKIKFVVESFFLNLNKEEKFNMKFFGFFFKKENKHTSKLNRTCM